MRAGRGFCSGASHGSQLGFGCQVICILLILSDSSHCDFIPGLPLPLALLSMWYVFVLPLTCQCDGARWVAAAHRVVMDTLRIRLGLLRGLALFLGTIPHAYLLLMSLKLTKIIFIYKTTCLYYNPITVWSTSR